MSLIKTSLIVYLSNCDAYNLGWFLTQVNGTVFSKNAIPNGVSVNGSAADTMKHRSSSEPKVNGVVATKYDKASKPEKPERKLNSKELIEKQRNWTSHFSKAKPTVKRYNCGGDFSNFYDGKWLKKIIKIYLSRCSDTTKNETKSDACDVKPVISSASIVHSQPPTEASTVVSESICSASNTAQHSVDKCGDLRSTER